MRFGAVIEKLRRIKGVPKFHKGVVQTTPKCPYRKFHVPMQKVLDICLKMWYNRDSHGGDHRYRGRTSLVRQFCRLVGSRPLPTSTRGSSDYPQEITMSVKKVKGGYRYGTKGKTYKSRRKAVKQGQAIKISQKGGRKK